MLSRLNPTWRDISLLRVVHFARLCVRSLRASLCEYKNEAKRVKISRATELNSLGYLSYAESIKGKGEVKTSLIKESRFTLTNERRVLTNDSYYERTTHTTNDSHYERANMRFSSSSSTHRRRPKRASFFLRFDESSFFFNVVVVTSSAS